MECSHFVSALLDSTLAGGHGFKTPKAVGADSISSRGC
jgi:hypothetical protein